MWGRVRLSSDVSEIKLVFSIPPERAGNSFVADSPVEEAVCCEPVSESRV